MPAKIDLNGIQRVSAKLGVEGAVELRLRDIDFARWRHMQRGDIGVPSKGRCQALQPGQRHFMEQLVGVALVDARESCNGQGRLDAHDGIGAGARSLG